MFATDQSANTETKETLTTYTNQFNTSTTQKSSVSDKIISAAGVNNFDYDAWVIRINDDIIRAQNRMGDYSVKPEKVEPKSVPWDREDAKTAATGMREREAEADPFAYQRLAKKYLTKLMFGDKDSAPYDAESAAELFLDPDTGFPDYRPDDFKSMNMRTAGKALDNPKHYLSTLYQMQHHGLAELYSAKITAQMLGLPAKYEDYRTFEDTDTKNAWKTALQNTFPLMAGGIEVGRHSFKTHAHIIFNMRQVMSEKIISAAGNTKNFKRLTSEKSLLGAYCYYNKERLHFPTEALPDCRQFTYWIEAKQKRKASGERRTASVWKKGIPKLSKALATSFEAVPSRIVTPAVWEMARSHMNTYITGDNKDLPSATCAKLHLENFPDAKPDMFLDNPQLPYNVPTLASYLDFCRLETASFADSIRYVNFFKKSGKEKSKRFQIFVEDRPRYYQSFKRRVRYRDASS